MDKYKETFKTWEKVAKIYQEKFMDLNLYDDTYDLFLNQISNSDGSILELGCGPGNITKYLLSQKPQLKIKGIDIAKSMIELAKENNPSAEFEQLDIRNIHTLKQQFDGIICGFCIPYLSSADCSKFFIDLKKLLKQSGTLYLSFVEGNPDDSGYLSGSTGDRTYFYYHSLEFIKNELDVNSFVITDLINKAFHRSNTNDEMHTIIIAKM